MKYYIIAGEASGDLHASNLMKQLKEKDPEAEFRCWGGDRMKNQGAHLVKHINELAFMGFWEVFINLKTILKNIKLCKQDILAYRPDVLILIDYPGFNLRMAEFAKKNGIKTVYYISPQVWAWKQSRVKKIRRYVDKMLVILPFEKAFYARFNYEVEFTGHPLLDAISREKETLDSVQFRKVNNLPDKPLVAILPGSRRQEITKMLKVMIAAAGRFPQYQFVIAGIEGLSEDFYRGFTEKENVSIVYGQTYPLLASAHAAMVASGTATLETALFEVPQVVCYKAGKVSFHIAKRLVKVKYISLVNLIMDREVVKELIQEEFNEAELANRLELLLHDKTYREELKNQYRELKEKLGGEGASKKAAGIIHNFLKNEA